MAARVNPAADTFHKHNHPTTQTTSTEASGARVVVINNTVTADTLHNKDTVAINSSKDTLHNSRVTTNNNSQCTFNNNKVRR